uniref:Uncharacterized protein n=1 Tax=Setaria italica TaxID=4555 RepID=K3ZPP7_SETIT
MAHLFFSLAIREKWCPLQTRSPLLKHQQRQLLVAWWECICYN